MSIAQNFPNLKPTLLLDFSNTEALDSRVTFTRASTATYYGTETAKAEENLLLQSQTFETTWSTTAAGAAVTANTTTAPDGTATADTLTEDSSTGVHLCFQQGSYAGVVTLSVFAKLGSGTRFLTIGLSRDTTNTASATFDLSLGTNTQTQANGAYSGASATVTAVAQGFYRCTLTVTTDTVTTFRIGLNDTGTPTSGNRAFGLNYTGDGTSSLILWGAQLEQRSAVTAYTPTTTQPITNYIPVLQTAASGVARFDHNPTTFESLGLLIEESRTNLLVYSEQFDNAAWTKGNTTVTANAVVSPDGTMDGDKLVEDTATSQHSAQQSGTLSAAGASTFSVYLKAGERQFVQVWLHDTATTGNRIEGYVNLTTGVVSNVQSVGTGWTAASIVVTSVGNGWLRVSLTGTSTVTAISARVRIASAVGTTTYTGDGYSGIYIWGAQLEAGAFATSYIPTVASQVTRAADSAVMTETNFTSWYNAAEGTLFSEASTYDVSIARVGFAVSIGNAPNRIQTGHGGGARLFIADNSVTQMTQALASVTYSNNTASKVSLAYKFNDANGAANNTIGTLDTVATIPAVTQARIGGLTATLIPLNGHVRRIAYYPIRVTDTQLQALTS